MKLMQSVMRGCLVFCLLGVAGFISAQEANVLTVGDVRVEMLIDEEMQGETSILMGASPEMIQKYIPTGAYSLAVTSALVRNGDEVMLIDAGLGYKLLPHLQERDIKPDDVKTILITHMHFDHIDGLMHEGKALFPNATLYISEPEVAYWTDDTQIDNFPEEQRELITGFFKKSQNVLDAYKGRVVTFSADEIGAKGDGLFPGIQALAAYGHTPGHTVFLLQNQGEKLLFSGDLWHVGALQFPFPDVTVTFDVNPDQAAQSRRAIFAYVAENAIPVTGMHQSNPDFGLIKPHPQEVGGYIFEMLEPLQ